MRVTLISARRPEEVARQVERLLRAGQRHFVVTTIDQGGMLDLERLGAARYAAGLQSVVALEEAAPVAVAAVR